MSQEVFYKALNQELNALLDKAWFTNLSSASALIMNKFENINWAGFYLTHNEELFLGPFQGKPACLRIPMGKGVCGTAAKTRMTVIVDDVHTFEGHIACDSASRSEIVVPLIQESRILGVLDIDSPNLKRFSGEDRLGLEEFVKTLVSQTQWPENFI